MNGIELQWAMPTAQAVAWSLVHFLWQGSLVGAVAAVLLRLLVRQKASTRYALAVGFLALLFVLPIGTAVRLAGGPARMALPAPLPRSDRPAPQSGAAAPHALRVAPDAPAAGASVLPVPATLVRLVVPLLPGIFCAWLCGVLLLGTYHLGGWWRVRDLVRQARPLDGALEERLRQLAGRLGVKRAVRLLDAAAIPVPSVIGWLRPAILLPASALAGLSPWQLDALLVHELAHVRRHDYLVNLLQAAVETLLFYHPAVWWLSNEIRREREHCCDDLAVAISGDRLRYARTLADLEGLRRFPQTFALGADGGSLLTRVRRLVGSPVRRSRRSWLVGFLALALVPAVFALRWQRGDGRSSSGSELASIGEAAGAPIAARGAAKTAARSGSRQGTWEAERDGDRVQLESTMAWKSDGGRHRWQNGETYPVAQLIGLTAGPAVRFELRRDAGRFVYEGSFHGNRGSGTFTFFADPAYVQAMAELGYAVDEARSVEMAIHDVSLAFVREIHALGYKNSSLDTLAAFRIHDVNPGLIREYAALGLPAVPADELVQLQIHEVSPDTVRGLLAAGLRQPNADELVQLQIHGVSPETIRALGAAGFTNLSADDLVQLQIHGVDGGFARSAVARYGPLTPDELVELKIRGRLDR